jgi:hypothetical protein
MSMGNTGAGGNKYRREKKFVTNNQKFLGANSSNSGAMSKSNN